MEKVKNVKDIILILEHKETKEKIFFRSTLEIKNFVQELFLSEDKDSRNIPLSSDEAIQYLQNDSENWQVIYRVKEKLYWEY